MTPHNIKQLKLLNSVVFPVSYNDKVIELVLSTFIVFDALIIVMWLKFSLLCSVPRDRGHKHKTSRTICPGICQSTPSPY